MADTAGVLQRLARSIGGQVVGPVRVPLAGVRTAPELGSAKPARGVI